MLGSYDFFCFSVLTLVGLVRVVFSHGYLIDPPQRSSLWRDGFNTTKNYDDNALNCGGQWKQHEINNGKCGLCGDAYDNSTYPHDHEIGGKFYTDIIARAYKMGSDIPVTVRLTTYHKGYFEFRLCAEVELSSDEAQACLNRNLLQVRSNSEDADYRFFPRLTNRDYFLSVSLPQGVTCDRCLFQWRYVTGKDSDGPQEWFVNCADISIYDKLPPTSTSPTTTSSTTTTMTTQATTVAPGPTPWDQCVPTAPYSAIPGMEFWCRILCRYYCPTSHCFCPYDRK